MKLSDGEKLIILMLSDVYKKLDIDAEIDADFVSSAIMSDNQWAIPWQMSGITFDDSETPLIVSEVCDILQMWTWIEQSYAEFSDAEKVQLEADVGISGKNPRFRGFDGNNECSYINVADFLINKMGRFVEFKDHDLNAHMPTIDMYGRMLSAYRKVHDASNYPLSVKQVASLLSEKVHPENR